ncbi:FtsW/RodA/SpoVE family cell cycle protein [Mitsuokella sp.]|uniref:FtsW/RodA/SpoVE family cell cycle protein n=1 Tax=unclassified Mitsuokella TaxID=2637239 RepID=UPI003D7D44AB
MLIRKTPWRNESEPVIVIMAVLLLLGTINVFSSSFVLATTSFNNPYYFLIRHVVWLILGIAVCFACSRINYHRWQSITQWLLIITIGALVLVLGVGTVVNGARRWLSFAGFSVQPAEFAKLTAILIAAKFLTVMMKMEKKINLLKAPPYWIIIVMAGLVELEPDMGTACIVLGVPLLMAFLVGIPWKQVKVLFFVVIGSIGGLIILQPYRLKRVLITYDPWSDAQGVGYQAVQSMSTIGSGGLWGMGLGEGVSKYEYLPEAHTDFAFAIFAQEHGYLGVLLVILLFFMLAVCCYYISARARDIYGQILTLGIMLLVVGQAAGNLFMVSGTFPVVGIPLPFISYGGSSLLVTMASMGILLNICHHGFQTNHESDLPQTPPAEAKEPVAPPLHLVK